MRKYLLDIPIDWLSDDELIHKLKLFILNRKPHQITTINPEFIVLSQKDLAFRHILQDSDLSLPDGTGVVLAQTFLDQAIPSSWLGRWLRFASLGLRFLLLPHSFRYKRITGVALTDLLLALSAKEGWRVFLLGAAPGVAQRAAARWQIDYPGVHIVGASSANPDDSHIIATIKQTNPDILLIAYGAPKQERFIAKHGEELKIPIMVGVGGTFDYAAGTVYRAPVLVRAIGLEWFIRLISQPKRLPRIYNSTFGFTRLFVQKYQHSSVR